MSWYEYSLALTYHILKSAKEWEHTRAVMHLIFCVNTTGEKPTPHDLLPLVTDVLPKPVIVTQEERDEMIAQALERSRFIPK